LVLQAAQPVIATFAAGEVASWPRAGRATEEGPSADAVDLLATALKMAVPVNIAGAKSDPPRPRCSGTFAKLDNLPEPARSLTRCSAALHSASAAKSAPDRCALDMGREARGAIVARSFSSRKRDSAARARSSEPLSVFLGESGHQAFSIESGASSAPRLSQSTSSVNQVANGSHRPFFLHFIILSR
jgi:hypothetical protein